jgi:rRNA-processing protein FCF1
MEVWPNLLSALADAAIAAVALNNRYDAIATFDQKLAKRMKDYGVPAYW